MKRSHVSSHDLELYVIDALDEDRAQDVEAHVAACGLCGDALAREARLERQLLRVAAHASAEHTPVNAVMRMPRAREPRLPSTPAAMGRALVIGATMAMAAAWMLWPSPRNAGAGAANRQPGATEPRMTQRPPTDDAATASLDAKTLDELDGGPALN